MSFEKKSENKISYNYGDLLKKVANNNIYIKMNDESNPIHIITAWVHTGDKQEFNSELIEEKGNRTVTFSAQNALFTRLNNIEKLANSIKLDTKDVVVYINYQGKRKNDKNVEYCSYFVQILEPEALVELAKKEAEAKKEKDKIANTKLDMATMIVELNELGLSNEEINKRCQKEITDLHGLIDNESALLIVHKKAIQEKSLSKK